MQRTRSSAELRIDLESEYGDAESNMALNSLEESLLACVLSADIIFAGREVGNGQAILYFETTGADIFVRSVAQCWSRNSANPVWKAARVVLYDQAELSLVEISCDELSQWLRTGSKSLKGRRRGPSRPRVGDYYSIPLSNGSFGHAKYVHHVPNECDLIQVLDVITPEPSPISVLLSAQSLFPIVKASVAGGIRHCQWRRIGHGNAATDFTIPAFRHSDKAFLTQQPGEYNDWFLWSGPDRWQFLGKLAAELRGLEFDVIWRLPDLAERILTGRNPYAAFV